MNVCSMVVVPLRLDHGERRRLWTMFAEQRQAFNFEVVATLETLERDDKTGRVSMCAKRWPQSAMMEWLRVASR